MKYGALKHRVAAAEQRLESHLVGAEVKARALQGTVRESATPARILIAGFAGGMLLGWFGPAKQLSRLPGLVKKVAGVPSVWTALGPALGMLRDAAHKSAGENSKD